MDFFPFRTDHSDAMETILAKVRDLPSQLSNFMQVSQRLSFEISFNDSPHLRQDYK